MYLLTGFKQTLILRIQLITFVHIDDRKKLFQSV